MKLHDHIIDGINSTLKVTKLRQNSARFVLVKK